MEEVANSKVNILAYCKKITLVFAGTSQVVGHSLG